MKYRKYADGQERATFILRLELTRDEITTIKEAAKRRAWTFHDELRSCFMEGLIDLQVREEDADDGMVILSHEARTT